MRLRVDFGISAYREVTWAGQLMDFPRIIKFNSSNYEWAIEDRTGRYDYILTFSKLNTVDPAFNKPVYSWEELFGNGGYVCECGARHSSFPWDHMRMCKMWRPW